MDAEELPEPSGQKDEQNGGTAGLREANGRWKRGIVQPGARPFKKGQTGNAGGKPAGVVQRVRDYLDGKARLSPGLKSMLVESGVDTTDLPGALAQVAIAIALSDQFPPAERLAALKWITDRSDGPIEKQIRKSIEGTFTREVVLLERLPGPPPDWPQEVLEIDALEAKAAAAQADRWASLGSAEPGTGSQEAGPAGDVALPPWSASRPRRRPRSG